MLECCASFRCTSIGCVTVRVIVCECRPQQVLDNTLDPAFIAVTTCCGFPSRQARSWLQDAKASLPQFAIPSRRVRQHQAPYIMPLDESIRWVTVVRDSSISARVRRTRYMWSATVKCNRQRNCAVMLLKCYRPREHQAPFMVNCHGSSSERRFEIFPNVRLLWHAP